MKKIILIILITIGINSFSQTFQTGTITLTFNDAARTGGFGSGGGPGRQIQTEIYYPATTAGSNVAVATGSFPVVVIGHGFLMGWNSYDNIYSELSKRGYIVALPRTEMGVSPSHQNFGLDIAQVGNKILQLNTTNTLAPIFVGKISPKLALAGHSMGGGSSFLAAQNNPSITCLFNFAAAETSPKASSAAKQVTVPTLIIGGEEDCVTPAATNQNIMWDSTAATKKFNVIIKNLTHCDFGNGTNFNCLFGQNASNCASTVNNTIAQNLYMNFLNPFLDFNLKDNCIEGTRFMDSINTSQVIFSKKLLGSLACITTKINNEEWMNSVSIYPNPTKDYVLIDDLNIKVEVFSIVGQLINVKNSIDKTKLSIDFSDLPNGIYFIKLSNNKSFLIKKVIKE